MEKVGLRISNAQENNRFDSDDEGAGMSVEDISEDEMVGQDFFNCLNSASYFKCISLQPGLTPVSQLRRVDRHCSDFGSNKNIFFQLRIFPPWDKFITLTQNNKSFFIFFPSPIHLVQL